MEGFSCVLECYFVLMLVGSGIGCILFLEYQLHAHVLLGSGLIFLRSSGRGAWHCRPTARPAVLYLLWLWYSRRTWFS